MLGSTIQLVLVSSVGACVEMASRTRNPITPDAHIPEKRLTQLAGCLDIPNDGVWTILQSRNFRDRDALKGGRDRQPEGLEGEQKS